MKFAHFTKAISALALASAAISAHAIPVTVFDNGSYVDTANASSESDLLQASLVKGGFTVSTFTAMTAAGISTALKGQEVLVIPEQEVGSMTGGMDAAALEVVRSFVANGGGLVISADYRSTLNTLFGFTLVNARATSSTLSTLAAGTEFAGGPATLSAPSATYGFTLASLPTGSASIYNSGLNSAVTVMHYGNGDIVQLGWDWFGAAPTGTVDGGWLSVLNRSVALAANTNQVPEPGSLALVFIALAAAALARRRN